MSKPSVMVFIYNSDQISGPNVSMRLLTNSFLKEKYAFREIKIDGRLGFLPRFGLLLRLIREIKDYKPDLLHITGLQLHGFYAVLAARLAGYQNIILTIRGTSRDALEISPFKKAILGSIIEPATLAMAKTVTTVCEDMAKRYFATDMYKKFAGVIPNAMPELNLARRGEYSIREELGLKSDDILLVYTGRIVMEKGIAFLLEAMRKIKNDKVRLLLCGDGKDEKKYQILYNPEILSRKAFFLHRRADVIDILRACDVFVFPTLHENLSNSLLEAMAVGLPIVATRVGGNPEVVMDGVNGYLVTPGDGEALKDAIERIIDDPTLAQRMGSESLRLGNASFTQSIVYRKYDELYAQTLFSMAWMHKRA
jgi:glycosyltransferase involved in cell wall biosynthesis